MKTYCTFVQLTDDGVLDIAAELFQSVSRTDMKQSFRTILMSVAADVQSIKEISITRIGQHKFLTLPHILPYVEEMLLTFPRCHAVNLSHGGFRFEYLRDHGMTSGRRPSAPEDDERVFLRGQYDRVYDLLELPHLHRLVITGNDVVTHKEDHSEFWEGIPEYVKEKLVC